MHVCFLYVVIFIYVFCTINIKFSLKIFVYNDERRDKRYHLYGIESGRPSCDISYNVCGDFRLGRDCFHPSGHNVFDVTLTDNIQHIYISQFFDTENITHRDKMKNA